MTTTLPAGWKPIPASLYDLILTGDLESLLWKLKGVHEAEEVRMALYNARQAVLVAEEYSDCTPPAAPTLSSLRGFAPEACDGMRSEDYVNKARNGGWLSPDCTPPASAQDAPITVSLDPDPRGVSVGVWQGSHCIYNGAHAVPSTQDDAKDERLADACPRCDGSGEITVMSDSSPDAHDVVVCCDHCQGSGSAVDAAKYLAAALSGEKYRHMQVWAEYRNFHRSLCARFGYGHDEIHFRRDLVSLEEAIAAKVTAPAAGDARAVAALAELVACDNLKRQLASMQACAFVETDAEFEEMDRIMSDLARRQPAAWDAARAVVAASQQQEG